MTDRTNVQAFQPETQSVKLQDQGKFIAASLKHRIEEWQVISRDQFILQAISGVKIPLRRTPPLSFPTMKELAKRSNDPVVDEAVAELLLLGAVEEIPKNSRACYRGVFTIPKTERGIETGRRFILNLKVS